MWGFSGATPQGRSTGGSWTSIRPLYIRACSGAGGGTKFGSILPISLQQIEYEKIHAVHSNELVKSYRMKSIMIYIDKYLRGDIVKLVVFHFLFFYSLPYSLLCKCIEFPLPTILPPYSDQENLTKYSLSSQVLMFGSILSISLQLIEYEKIHAVHSNELAKSYTMKPISIFIDQLKYDLWEFNKNRPFFTVFCPYLFKKSHI